MNCAANKDSEDKDERMPGAVRADGVHLLILPFFLVRDTHVQSLRMAVA